eukprot:456010_1
MDTASSTSINENVRQMVETSFQKVKRSARRSHLILEEILALDSLPTLDINLNHLGILYTLDSSHSGRFSLAKLIAFTDMCESVALMYTISDIQRHIQGLCTLKMWTDTATLGHKHLKVWLMNCVRENAPLRSFKSDPDVEYVHQISVQALYKILDMEKLRSLSFSEFLGLVQLAGEQSGYLELSQERFDNLVPLSVLDSFCESIVEEYMTMMRGVGLSSAYLQPLHDSLSSLCPSKCDENESPRSPHGNKIFADEKENSLCESVSFSESTVTESVLETEDDA